MNLYINQTASIAPQNNCFETDISLISNAVNGKLIAKEPVYTGIPAGILRRMGKSVRMGVGAALQLIDKEKPMDGIIIGTANGGMEDCMKFLEQLIQYNEGLLTPASFVQGIPNAVAGQLGLITANKGYNVTHVHRGLAFENAVLDAMMQLNDFPGNSYLLGAVDEISNYNYNIELLNGNYKKVDVTAADFYNGGADGSVAGEGGTMFVVSKQPQDAQAAIVGITTIHSTDEQLVSQILDNFLLQYLPENETIDMLISGENGDQRLDKFYKIPEKKSGKEIPVIRYKHLCGEYATASSFALWLTCELLKQSTIPSHLLKSATAPEKLQHILLYNSYAGEQHSFMLVKNMIK